MVIEERGRCTLLRRVFRSTPGMGSALRQYAGCSHRVIRFVTACGRWHPSYYGENKTVVQIQMRSLVGLPNKNRVGAGWKMKRDEAHI